MTLNSYNIKKKRTVRCNTSHLSLIYLNPYSTISCVLSATRRFCRELDSRSSLLIMSLLSDKKSFNFEYFNVFHYSVGKWSSSPVCRDFFIFLLLFFDRKFRDERFLYWLISFARCHLYIFFKLRLSFQCVKFVTGLMIHLKNRYFSN